MQVFFGKENINHIKISSEWSKNGSEWSLGKTV